jgi:hypothetical protein
MATVSIISFRSSGEYVELHTRVIERPDSTVYIASDAPRLAVVGTWAKDGDSVTATRQRVKRPVAFKGPRDPLCNDTLRFQISGNSVIGRVIESTPGSYSPITRLVAPEYESYLGEAREEGVPCTPPEA